MTPQPARSPARGLFGFADVDVFTTVEGFLMRLRFTLACVGLAFLVACGSKSPTSPTPTPTPTPTTFSMSGIVSDTSNGAGVNGATVTVIDGPNAGKSGTADGAGHYQIANLQPGGFTARARAQYYNEFAKPMTLSSNATLDFALAPIPLFKVSGKGDTVFDMPTTVRRVTITAHYTGYSSNFIVHIGGEHLVNELVGTGWNAVDFSGTYLTSGGVVEITKSSGVSWTFTEVR